MARADSVIITMSGCVKKIYSYYYNRPNAIGQGTTIIGDVDDVGKF